MSTSRREFMSLTLASYAAFALGHGKAHARRADAPAAPGAAKPLRILVLGGTGFLGPATIQAALDRGHTVTMFNRGRGEKRRKEMGRELPFMDKVEKLYGNRDPNLTADENDPASPKGLEQLAGRTWDAVIDNSGYVPRVVKASAEMLAPHVKHYTFISSISAYADNSKAGSDETSAVATLTDPTTEEVNTHYGALKAACEAAAEAAMPGRVANVRPGFIVGPLDPTPRFTYWPVRVSQAKDDRRQVLVPGTPTDPVQVIDVRDLGAWLVRLAEDSTTGMFNATGPAERMTAADLMAACKQAADTDPEFLYAGAGFLQENGVAIGSFPILIPPIGEYTGFHQWSNARAIAKGLTFRPIVDTCRDTLAFYNGLPEEIRVRISRGFPEPNIETKLVGLLRAQQG